MLAKDTGKFKRVKRIVEGICDKCAGLGWIITPNGQRADCVKCGRTGKKLISVVEVVHVDE